LGQESSVICPKEVGRNPWLQRNGAVSVRHRMEPNARRGQSEIRAASAMDRPSTPILTSPTHRSTRPGLRRVLS
jgi:hypothetical protein